MTHLMLYVFTFLCAFCLYDTSMFPWRTKFWLSKLGNRPESQMYLVGS